MDLEILGKKTPQTRGYHKEAVRRAQSPKNQTLRCF